jgi:hypothetical protein
VHVLVRHEHGLRSRHTFELIDQHLERALFLALRRHLRQDTALARGDPEQRCDQGRRLVQLVGAARQERFQLVEPCTVARSGDLELAGEPEDEAWSRSKQYAWLSCKT